MSTSSTATAETLEAASDGSYARKQYGCGKMGKRKWSAVEVGIIIAGFVVFWPAGLVALGIKLVTGELWKGSSHSVSPWAAYHEWKAQRGDKAFAFSGAFGSHNWQGHGTSGNAAFDAYKKEQLDRLEAERRKLEDEQRAFAEHLAKLRRAKDQDEFDRFMAERNAPKGE
jgi:Protein of unknown function (DUF2852)